MKRLALALFLLPSLVQATTRTEVMAHAKAYALHPWTSKAANQTGSCSASYKSLFAPGDYLGLPYDWGGYMTLAEFDAQIQSGLGAGSQPADGILACTAGVDCSGFVSGCWKSGHFTTSTIDTTSSVITQAELLAGDVINKAGEHVVLFSHLLASGAPFLYESGGYNVHQQPFGGWSYVMGYTPRRYNQIEGTSAADPLGTTSNPIVIGALPYSDDRDTSQSASKDFDRCALAPSTNEGGPEYVYKLVVSTPGMLTVAVTDDAGSDMDVHLYSSFNSNDCLARHDSSFTTGVDCGTYHVVVDSFVNSSGKAQVGNYHLTVSSTPSGAACGAGPHVYAQPGKPGDKCDYPGHDGIGFCNPTLGADTCVYSTAGGGDSFCSRPCDTVADCGAYPGGCCQDLSGMGDKYCMLASWCGGASSTTPKPPPMDITDGGAAADGGEVALDGGGVADGPAAPSEGSCAVAGAGSAAPSGLALLAILFLLRRRQLRA